MVVLYRCPNCGKSDQMKVERLADYGLSDSGVLTHPGEVVVGVPDDEEWRCTTTCRCLRCGASGPVGEFKRVEMHWYRPR